MTKFLNDSAYPVPILTKYQNHPEKLLNTVFWPVPRVTESESSEGEFHKLKKNPPYVEMQINTVLRYHYIPNRRAKIIIFFKVKISNSGVDTEKLSWTLKGISESTYKPC